MLCVNKPIWLLVRFTLCTLNAWCLKKKLFKIFRKILKYLVVARVHYPGVGKIMCRYMFLNSATLIRPLPLKARVLGYEGARILGEKNVCNGVEHIPPPSQ